MTDEEIQRLLDEGKADARHVEALKKCGPGVFCVHRSWGFGRIASFDAILGKFLIDFKGKAGHPMEARYAAESLEILLADHVLARKVTDLDNLKRLASDQPLELMRVVLTSFGGQATIDQITSALCPEVVATADWKKWWDGAKRVMKKDPHFVVAARKTEPCVLRGEPMRPEQELLKSFEAATGLKEKTATAEQLLRVADRVADAKGVLEPVIHALSAEIKKSLHHDPATTLEAIWVRDELANLCGHQAHHTVGEIHEIVKNVRQLGELLESLPATKQKRLLPHVRTVYPDTWHDTLRQLVMTADAKLAGDIIEFLVAEDQADAVQAFLDRVIREQTAPSELLLWVCRSRSQQAFATMIGPLLNARLASAILHALQREQLQTTRRKNQLLDYLLNESTLIADLLRAADLEEARDIARRILIHPAIGEMDRRSLMARIIKLHPPIQALLTAGAEVRQQAVTVSWESLEQRKTEYDELVTKRIPANSKDIAIARSYGDLSENYEFKAAKETQRVLMARKAELETMLAIARGTDFADAKTEAVGIGACVTLTDMTDNKPLRYCVLGAWDSDVERGIISYQTAMAQALVGKRVGDEADFEIGGHRHHVRVEKIERYVDVKAEIGPPIPQPAVSAPAPASSAAPASTSS